MALLSFDCYIVVCGVHTWDIVAQRAKDGAEFAELSCNTDVPFYFSGL